MTALVVLVIAFAAIVIGWYFRKRRARYLQECKNRLLACIIDDTAMTASPMWRLPK